MFHSIIEVQRMFGMEGSEEANCCWNKMKLNSFAKWCI